MSWATIVAGTVLAATDNLTKWWGIAIVAVVFLAGYIGALAGDRAAPTDEQRESSGVFRAVERTLVNPPVIAGLFIGNEVGEAVGAAVGAIGAGLLASLLWSLYVTRLEMRRNPDF